MGWALRRFPLTKAVPLAISRGTTAAVERLELRLDHDGVIGRGETGGLNTGHRAYQLAGIEAELQALLPRLNALNPRDRHGFDACLSGLSPPACCAVDLALWDWWGVVLQQPIWRLCALDGSVVVATSVTLGLATVEWCCSACSAGGTRCHHPHRRSRRPDGLDHDRALLVAVAQSLENRRQATGGPVELQVDANGGWTLDQAKAMVADLIRADVVLLEQPLAAQQDPERDAAGFAALKPDYPLPLVADESCWSLEDLLRLAPHVDGVNLKLLKTGGLSEALLMARVAQRLGLDLMVGCYSDSSLLNGAAAQLLPFIRWPDLDSHLNLVDDPYTGLCLDGDRLKVPAAPGLGIDRQEGR